MKNKKVIKLSSLIVIILIIIILAGSALYIVATKEDGFWNKKNKAEKAKISISSIGVSLLENGEIVAKRNSMGNDIWDEVSYPILKEIGKQSELTGTYEENLSVRNSGTLGIYVRCIIEDKSEKKNIMNLNVLEENGWIPDRKLSNEERKVYYYNNIIAAGKEIQLSNTISFSSEIYDKYEMVKDESGNIHLNTGMEDIYMSIEIDAVQDNNVADAIESAWNVKVNIAPDGTLSLIE